MEELLGARAKSYRLRAEIDVKDRHQQDNALLDVLSAVMCKIRALTTRVTEEMIRGRVPFDIKSTASVRPRIGSLKIYPMASFHPSEET